VNRIRVVCRRLSVVGLATLLAADLLVLVPLVAAASSDSPPAAVLLVTPASAITGLPVTADASSSIDLDATPVASYTFNFGDGTVTGPQASASASNTYVAVGSYAVAVTVADSAGFSSTATATVVVRANVVGNPGFEVDTAGWNAAGIPGVALTRVAGGHSGSSAALLANGGTAAAPCILNDSPNWVARTIAGPVVAGLWARADATGAVLKLKLREYNASTLVGSAASSIILTTAWQPISASYTPVAPGTSTLDFQAFVSSAPPGACFYADDVGITVGTGAEVGPAAELGMTPDWGAVAMTMTADASRSADLDSSSIAAYTFDFSDGTVVGPQPSAIATHTFGAAGTFLVTVVVADAAGLRAGAAATVVVDAPPVAALSVTPPTGMAPLAVSADASGSTDLDGTPIASYSFDFGDGTVTGPQATAIATHTYLVGGTYVVTVAVKDTAGLWSTATAGLLVRAELVGNPGFETSTDGWNTAGVSGVTLDRVPGGHSGSWSALLANTSPTPTYCVLNDSPNWVPNTAAGTYTGAVWVRADIAGASVSLSLREYNRTGTFLGETEQTVWLTTGWQQISLTYTAVSPGSSTLDFQVEESGAPTGACFYADDASIGLS
jgi:hypothetical protein